VHVDDLSSLRIVENVWIEEVERDQFVWSWTRQLAQVF